MAELLSLGASLMPGNLGGNTSMGLLVRKVFDCTGRISTWTHAVLARRR